MIFHCHVDWRVTKTCWEKDLSWTVGQISGEPRTKVLAGILSMWSPSARVMANLGRHPELPWSAVGTQEVPARYMPFTRSLMMCPPAEIGAASYDFQTHKGWKNHGKKTPVFLNAVALSEHLQIPDWVSQYPKICWHTASQNFRPQQTAGWTIPCLEFILHVSTCIELLHPHMFPGIFLGLYPHVSYIT